MGFGTVNAHMEYTEFANNLNDLEADLQLANPWSLWNYAVNDIDFMGVAFNAVDTLDHTDKNLDNDFSTGSQNSFDTTRPCAVCGEIGNNFFNCPELRVSHNQFINLIQD